MSEEDRLKLENELLLTKSKAQMINLYLDLQQKVEQLEKDKSYANWYAVKKEKEVEQLENIRKEAIEYINKNWGHWCSNHYEYATETINILNKGSDFRCGKN